MYVRAGTGLRATCGGAVSVVAWAAAQARYQHPVSFASACSQPRAVQTGQGEAGNAAQGGAMFFTYIYRELRRRHRQALLTALGLAVGVALVVAVTAYAGGVSNAQNQVLHSLYGVGTDISVTQTAKFRADPAARSGSAWTPAARSKQGQKFSRDAITQHAGPAVDRGRQGHGHRQAHATCPPPPAASSSPRCTLGQVRARPSNGGGSSTFGGGAQHTQRRLHAAAFGLAGAHPDLLVLLAGVDVADAGLGSAQLRPGLSGAPRDAPTRRPRSLGGQGLRQAEDPGGGRHHEDRRQEVHHRRHRHAARSSSSSTNVYIPLAWAQKLATTGPR